MFILLLKNLARKGLSMFDNDQVGEFAYNEADKM